MAAYVIHHSAATGNLMRVPERGPGIRDLVRHVLGTVDGFCWICIEVLKVSPVLKTEKLGARCAPIQDRGPTTRPKVGPTVVCGVFSLTGLNTQSYFTHIAAPKQPAFIIYCVAIAFQTTYFGRIV